MSAAVAGSGTLCVLGRPLSTPPSLIWRMSWRSTVVLTATVSMSWPLCDVTVNVFSPLAMSNVRVSHPPN
jgi:hypothetical protein